MKAFNAPTEQLWHCTVQTAGQQYFRTHCLHIL